MLMANFCDQIYEQSGTELCFMCLTICSYVSRNSREFCLLVSFQSSFTPWNHMLATISTFLQLSLQYCCTTLHLPFTLMYTLTTFHHNYLYQNKYVAHILSTYPGRYNWWFSAPFFTFRFWETTQIIKNESLPPCWVC